MLVGATESWERYDLSVLRVGGLLQQVVQWRRRGVFGVALGKLLLQKMHCAHVSACPGDSGSGDAIDIAGTYHQTPRATADA